MPRTNVSAPARAPDSPAVLQEILDGTGIPLASAGRLAPAVSGRPASPSTVWRWVADGVPVPGGGRAHLEAARLGCRWYTTRAALMRFLAAQNGQPAPRPVEASRLRERQISEAERALKAAGV